MMHCKHISWGKSHKGNISKCANCNDEIVLSYKNFSHSLIPDDFYKLKALIDQLDAKAFFEKHPMEERMHIRTNYKDLFFCFTQGEIAELKGLLAEAALKIKMLDYIQEYLN